jgi:signal transduction histidine kinase
VDVWGRLSTTGRDSVLALAAAVVVFGAAVAEGAAAPAVELAVLSAAVSAPLVLRRRFPLATAMAAAAVSLVGLGLPEWSGRLVVMAAFCSAAYHGVRPVVALAASVGWFMAISLLGVQPTTVAAFAEIVLTGVAPVAVGVALRVGRRHAEQAAQLHRAEAARTIAVERAAVARNVHDAVGHHLTAIRMQAAAAQHVLQPEMVPPVAVRALATIDEVAAAAITDVRAVLEVLREQGPLVAVSDVRDLAARLSTPGCPITVTCADSEVPLGVEGHLVLREALTNAVRHAGATRVDVQVAHHRDTVTILVEDDGAGPAPSPDTEGSGIRGMRERVRQLGGTLQITGRQPSGWCVRADLPIR